jgi:cytochrome c
MDLERSAVRRAFLRQLTGLTVAGALATPIGVTASEPTKDDAVRMVEKAIAMHKTQGRDKTLAEVNRKEGSFVKGELYVFAFDPTGTVIGHPHNPKLVGKNNIDVPDQDGKYYRRTIVETASSAGSGWVDFKDKNPESGRVEGKTAYFKKHGDVIYACGIYL